jgi:hypothetical protein
MRKKGLRRDKERNEEKRENIDTLRWKEGEQERNMG